MISEVCPICGASLIVFHDRATCSDCGKKFVLLYEEWIEIFWTPQKTSGGHKFAVQKIYGKPTTGGENV